MTVIQANCTSTPTHTLTHNRPVGLGFFFRDPRVQRRRPSQQRHRHETKDADGGEDPVQELCSRVGDAIRIADNFERGQHEETAESETKCEQDMIK